MTNSYTWLKLIGYREGFFLSLLFFAVYYEFICGFHRAVKVPDNFFGNTGYVVRAEKDTCDNLWYYGSEIVSNNSLYWKPFNCEMVFYRNLSNLEQCMLRLPTASKKSKVSVLFVGDSRMRQLQIALFRELTGRTSQMNFNTSDDFCDRPDAVNLTWVLHSPILQSCSFRRVVEPYNFKIERWWAPYFSSNVLSKKIRCILELPIEEAPSLIFINAGIWLIRDCGNQNTSFEDCLNSYTRDIVTLMPSVIRLTQRSTVVWVLQNNLNPCSKWTHFKANTRIGIFNDVAIQMFRRTKVKIWRSYFQLFDFLGSDGDDMHMGEATLAMEVQIILNYLCNIVTEQNPKFCCVKTMENQITKLNTT